jgi:hypothetical protein
MGIDPPEFREWSVAAVWLLKDVVYFEDQRVWNIVLANFSPLETHFSRLGLRVMVDESEGMAYLRQLTDDEMTTGYEAIPKLFRSSRLSYGQTLLCVLLRDELRGFEEEDVRNERCVIEETALLDQWKGFFRHPDDEVKQQREMLTSLRRLEDLGFVRRFSVQPASWEILRILKARLPATELEGLKAQLAAAVARRGSEAMRLVSED